MRGTIAKRVENGTQEVREPHLIHLANNQYNVQIEMLSWLSRTAFELIGQSGLGVSFDALDDEERDAALKEWPKEVGRVQLVGTVRLNSFVGALKYTSHHRILLCEFSGLATRPNSTSAAHISLHS